MNDNGLQNDICRHSMEDLFKMARTAAHSVAWMPAERTCDVLDTVADAIESSKDLLIEANKADLEKMDTGNPLYDRLLLNEKRLHAIADDMRNVAAMPSPLGHVTKERTLDNGLHLRRISVPFGVIGVIYEARPNVTFDVFSLCMKSGNACILKGGHDAENSNRAAVDIIRGVLRRKGIDESAVTLLPSTHDATAAMLNARGYIDLCIPRGGRRLIDFVRQNAHIPVIETGAGVVSAFFDKDGDTAMGARIINNAKTRRVSVCNALDCLIIHSGRLNDLYALCAQLADSDVRIYADTRAEKALRGKYPDNLLHSAGDDAFGTEFMDYAMAIKTVDSTAEAMTHIERYDSGHSECIITGNDETAATFQQQVDAACVYVNAPTSFTDGAQFGLGAEIGISTQKLGPRGPMALEEMTTYKWLINGTGQTRP